MDFDRASISALGDECAGFGAATELNREDWGPHVESVALKTGRVLVGKKARIELDGEAVAVPRA